MAALTLIFPRCAIENGLDTLWVLANGTLIAMQPLLIDLGNECVGSLVRVCIHEIRLDNDWDSPDRPTRIVG